MMNPCYRGAVFQVGEACEKELNCMNHLTFNSSPTNDLSVHR